MPDLPIILGITFLAMLVQATFSFGGALVALPLLALFVEVKFATVLMTMLSATIAVMIVIRNWNAGAGCLEVGRFGLCGDSFWYLFSEEHRRQHLEDRAP